MTTQVWLTIMGWALGIITATVGALGSFYVRTERRISVLEQRMDDKATQLASIDSKLDRLMEKL